MNRGSFITFEGPEGSGKSTQIRLLADRLIAAGRTVMMTREPGGTPSGEAIRRLLQHDATDEEMGMRTEVLLFCASRAQLVEQVIEPALAGGTWVLCDRFTDSTLAYQGYGRGFALDALRSLNAFATGGLIPDLTLLLDIPYEEGLRRVAARQGAVASAGDRFERTERAFHERVRQGYLELAAAEPDRFRIVGAGALIGHVSEEIGRAVSERFGARA